MNKFQKFSLAVVAVLALAFGVAVVAKPVVALFVAAVDCVAKDVQSSMGPVPAR
jgi:hypothetical protein